MEGVAAAFSTTRGMGDRRLLVQLREREASHGLSNFAPQLVHLLDEPLHDGEDGGIVKALDLMRLQGVAAFHFPQRSLD